MVEVKVVAETQVVTWYFEEVGWGSCKGPGIALPPLIVGSELGGML